MLYIHTIEGVTQQTRDVPDGVDFLDLRRRFGGRLYRQQPEHLDLAEKELAEGRADLFSFGRPYLANPDLVGRLASGAPLAEAPKQYWYGGGATVTPTGRAWTGRYRYGAEPITEIGTSPIVTEATACFV